MKKLYCLRCGCDHGECNRRHADSSGRPLRRLRDRSRCGRWLVAGAIIGGAVANARPAPVYVEPAPVYAVPVRTCLVEQQVWSPRYQAYVMRPVRVAC